MRRPWRWQVTDSTQTLSVDCRALLACAAAFGLFIFVAAVYACRQWWPQ
jgi:hypothetical protein